MISFTTEVFTIKNPKNKLRAYGSLLIDLQGETKLKVKGFKIFEGSNGVFVKPPQTKGSDKEGNDTWYDDITFMNDDENHTIRNEVYEDFVTTYNKYVKEA